jgi:hypothetical protein
VGLRTGMDAMEERKILPLQGIEPKPVDRRYADWAMRNVKKLSMCLVKHHAMKTYKGVEVYCQACLTSVLDSEWSTSRPGRFALLYKLIDPHWI